MCRTCWLYRTGRLGGLNRRTRSSRLCRHPNRKNRQNWNNRYRLTLGKSARGVPLLACPAVSSRHAGRFGTRRLWEQARRIHHASPQSRLTAHCTTQPCTAGQASSGTRGPGHSTERGRRLSPAAERNPGEPCLSASFGGMLRIEKWGGKDILDRGNGRDVPSSSTFPSTGTGSPGDSPLGVRGLIRPATARRRAEAFDLPTLR